MLPEPLVSGGSSVPAEQLVDDLHRALLEDTRSSSQGIADPHGALLAEARRHDPLLTGALVEAVVARVQARVEGLGPLEPLLADPTVDEVMLNGGGEVWVERHGRLECTGVVVDEPTALALIERIVAPLGLHIDRASPLVDARLPDGSRVNAVVRPLAIDGPCLTIRRFGARAVALDEVATPGTSALLAWAVRARANVVVCGGAGAGKTTLLNALAAEIGDRDRVVTIEDAAELRLPGRHVVRLEARPASAEGAGEVRVRDLVRNALRMRPDRIVVGEVRSGEALDMLQAMNTGHEGSLSTCHANSPADALRRLETLVLMGDVALPLAAVREQVRSALDLVVQIARRPDGSRSVVAVAEVAPDGDGAHPLAVRALTDPDGRLRQLPQRAVRSAATPPADSAWLEAP
ncbi:MAG TPA: CpaF family protein [Acidimicrobiales bacterium]